LKLKITVDGKTYEVDVEVAEPDPPHLGYVSPMPQQARVAAAPAAAAPPAPGLAPVADEAKVCRSPFAGMVARIPAQIGQSIQVQDVLLVLEAMKMETVVTSPLAGKVVRINVKVGDAVQAGQLLVEFE
jgi:methylmalonyl-CoA carboxyltransferase small subunit